MINQDSLNRINFSIQDTLKVIDSGSTLSNPNFYVSIVIAFIALLALIIPYIHSYYKERKRLKSLSNYVLYILEQLIEPIEKKTESLKTLFEQIKDIDSGNLAFKDSSNLLVDVFMKIDHKDLHHIFVVNSKNDEKGKQFHFKQIVDAIDFFNKQNIYDKQNFTQFFNDLRRYETSFTEGVDSIFRLFYFFQSYNKRKNIKPSEDAFLKGFDKILYDYQQTENPNSIKITKDQLLNPLKKYCQDNSDDPRAIQTIPNITKANYAHLNIVTARELYSRIFNDTKDMLLIKMTNLQNAIKFYKS